MAVYVLYRLKHGELPKRTTVIRLLIRAAFPESIVSQLVVSPIELYW